jgi:DNA polymerase IIIc chi subunit
MDIRYFFARPNALPAPAARGSEPIYLQVEQEEPPRDHDMIVKLQNAFATKKAKDITALSLQAIDEAECESELKLFTWVMDGYTRTTEKTASRLED